MRMDQLASLLPTPDDERAWYDVIGKFHDYTAKFWTAYNQLKSTHIDAAKYPELSELQLDLLRRASEVRMTIQNITGSIDGAWTWLKSKFGFNGLADAAYQTGLGALPLIPIAAVVGAVTLITKWLLDFDTFNKKLAEVKRLEAKGYSSAQASEIVEKTYGGSFFNLGNVGTVAVVGVVGLLLFINRDKLRLG